MLILASASPRRHELLLAAGIPHVVRPAGITEDRNSLESPETYAVRLAEEKARAISAGEEDVILGADTVVSIDEEVLGKPAGPRDAARMLALLSGRVHSVYTGICIHSRLRSVRDVSHTRVEFASLSEQEISAYVASGEPFDKAGGYAIQGLASKFITSIQGCYSNVVGLPVSLVYRHLKSL
jgi:septum formation protein